MIPISRVTAFITGATGFIGSVLCRKIVAENGIVYALVRENSKNIDRLPVDKNLKVIYGDLDDFGYIREQLSQIETNINVFYHLGWKGVGNKDRNDPVQSQNIESTIQSLLLAHSLGCSKWVGTGSQAEYGPINSKISEEHLTKPTTFYGASKLSACILSQVLGHQLNMSTVWARIFSTYGPGDNSGWMLIDLINTLLDKQKPKLTLGEQLWDYLYVDDAANALYKLGTAVNSQGVYNLGSGNATKLKKIIEITRDLIDPALPLGFGEIPYRIDQVMHLEADVSKLIRDTGWQAEIDLETGLRRTIDYIKNEKNKVKE
ncbi:NAD-dependent epimerase/dehydratase family protein [Paenibacillus elgii]|uniref:NAD-dependent epimerase/dehydratase family protein n=1 Tax=Paenibacillus elgii TaxID=189691 RepID=UPI000248CEB8|nr:NAD(P)-dependent oxidoreductase [Paenibacillus elgii]